MTALAGAAGDRSPDLVEVGELRRTAAGQPRPDSAVTSVHTSRCTVGRGGTGAPQVG